MNWKRTSKPTAPKEPDMWDEDLTAEEEESLLRQAATEIRKRKMETPSIWFLEMHKPLSNVAAQSSVALSPFLVPLLGYDFVNNYSRLFSKRENVERLITKLESDEEDLTEQRQETPC